MLMPKSSDVPLNLSVLINRTLLRLLKDSADPIVLAVAAHDVGQYVKHYERGKKYVSAALSVSISVSNLHPDSSQTLGERLG